MINYGQLASEAFIETFGVHGYVSEGIVYFYDIQGGATATEENTSAFDSAFANKIEAWNALEYQRNRVLEYPSIGDQLDALFHAGVFPAEMAAQIQAVKDKYPKGGNA